MSLKEEQVTALIKFAVLACGLALGSIAGAIPLIGPAVYAAALYDALIPQLVIGGLIGICASALWIYGSPNMAAAQFAVFCIVLGFAAGKDWYVGRKKRRKGQQAA